MKNICLITSVYNAERTLARAIESCLGQSYGDFTYLLVDNGSTDGTGAIIKKYAEADGRIITKFYKTNDWFRLFEMIDYALTLDKDTKYIATLDGDDEYKPEFLKQTLDFVSKHNLDVALCGTDWVDAHSGALIRQKSPKQDIILEGRAFLDKFPEYRPYALTVWGALYSHDVLSRTKFSTKKVRHNFADTVFVLEALRTARRAGVLGCSLHKYYVEANYASKQWYGDCFLRTLNFMAYARSYMEHFSQLSSENENYLLVLFLIMLKYILHRVQSTNIDLADKLEILSQIFSNERTQQLLKANWKEIGIVSEKEEFIDNIRNWLNNQPSTETYPKMMHEIMVGLHCCDGADMHKQPDPTLDASASVPRGRHAGADGGQHLDKKPKEAK